MRKILLSVFASTAISASAADIYVAPNGADANDGSIGKPLKSLRIALRQARNLRRLNDPSVKGGVTIHVAKGTYNLYEPLYVRPEDSGTPDSPTLIKGDGAVISGGVAVTGWRKEGKLLVADTPEFNGNLIDFRQFYVNGKKAVRARDVADFSDMAHIRSLDKPNQIIYVPATAAVKALARQYAGKAGQYVQPAEMVLHEMWCVANLRIKDINIQGDSAAIRFHQPESTIQFEHPWPSPMVNTKPFTREDGKVLNLNSAFYLTGAKALLDTPGEWYHDVRSHKLYYYPHNGETAAMLNGGAQAIVPALETLVEVEGTLERPVHDVRFEGITFSYSTWMRPTTDGHVPLQAGMYMYEGYKLRPQTRRPDRNNGLDNQGFLGRPASAVTVCGSNDIVFDGCTFTHLGSSGVDYEEGTHGGVISNCTFTDIAGSGIVAGSFSPSAFETHLPYDPLDRRVVVDGLVIANNYISDVTNEDWGTLGINCGYVANTIIAHNEICEVSYSGVNLGWGWTQSVNCMRGNEVYRNYIHHYAKHMYDCAGIYTLSSQIKTYITENVVDDIYHPIYAHDPNHWFYLYCDEGSSGITVQDNWTPAEKYLQNSNGPCNTWENNGPAVNDSVKANAGVKKGLDIAGLRAKIQIKKPKKAKQ
ncbi:MAG: right-handed parallel beta-helix repeat-containing protein [Prevotella sp.]|nr:right-handed parallel beta-helix repeat-containing protein [Prevotella sp.]